ncbi:starch synthase [bacterium A37T11]|nr:starch synthase [bacterium A37T11]
MSKQPSFVIHVSAECYPVAKVGGLGDVIGSLPKYQHQMGVKTWVVMPWYEKPFMKKHRFELVFEGSFFQGSQPLQMQVFKEVEGVLGFDLYVLKIPGLLDRPEVYGYQDESEQFMAFQHGFLHWLTEAGIVPELVHCHDHHMGLIPFLMYHAPKFFKLKKTPTLATVHNAQYQGWMDWNRAILLPPFDTWKWGLLDWGRCINPLATLIKCCTAFTAVSKGYLQELFVQSNGLEALFNMERAKGHGIVNGIDSAVWDSATDPMLTSNYSITSVQRGKKENKENIFNEFGLIDPKQPLLVFIGRFVHEKGADLLPDIILRICTELPDKLSIFVLGSGDTEVQQAITSLASRFPGQVAASIGYHEGLAHRLYAAADFLIMPSRVEPCGLNQLYALRYGTLPIVHKVGGLKDTVIDLAENDGYGITFDRNDAAGVMEALNRGVAMFKTRGKLGQLRKKMMQLDFSWDKSAAEYIALYKRLIEDK